MDDKKSSIKHIEQTLHSPIAAELLEDEIEKTYKKIKETPFMYPPVPDKYLASLGYRYTVMVNNYMMFYIVDKEEIRITRFLYGYRDWINILQKAEKKRGKKVAAAAQ